MTKMKRKILYLWSNLIVCTQNKKKKVCTLMTLIRHVQGLRDKKYEIAIVTSYNQRGMVQYDSI